MIRELLSLRPPSGKSGKPVVEFDPYRRRLIKRSAYAGGLSLLGQTAWAREAAPENPPNILFILADDLGYADLSCYGARDYQTPVLDNLAAQGVKLTQAYANSAVCSATRTALMTGRYQYRLPVGLEEPVPKYNADLGLPPSAPTVASLLKKAGYQTALAGKWHLGAPPNFGPLKSGFDHFFGFYPGGLDYFTHLGRPLTGEQKPYEGLYEDERLVTREGYLTDVLADDVIARIGAADGGAPFLINLHFNAPHWPWEGPHDADIAKRLTGLRDDDGGNLKIYGEMVQAMDAAIGRVLKALDSKGLADNTIVIFTSDNGGERFSDVWPFVGMKGELLEGGLRVPAIVRWPGHLKAGAKCDQVTISMDWVPTLLAAAGGAPDPASPFDGQSILPQLEGAPTVKRELFWRYHANDQAAVRKDNWKYIKILDKEYLFDLASDQRERANVKDHQAAIFAELKADFAAWNAKMLPYPEKFYSETPKGRMIDRY